MEIDGAENLSATELRLGLPGTSSSSSDGDSNRPKKRPSPSSGVKPNNKRALDDTAGDDDQDAATPAKTQVVGWPPVRRAHRKNTTTVLNSSLHSASAAAAANKKPAEEQQQQMPAGGGTYVKVSMDGAPYLRKVDLRMCNGYRQLREALDALFFSANKSVSSVEGFGGDHHHQRAAVAYEDKDGDLMLVGDVPWEMFVSSCKKLRIMKGCSEGR